MNLQYGTPDDVARHLNTTTHELSDYDIKGALINAMDRISRLENKMARLETENQKNIKALADAGRA